MQPQCWLKRMSKQPGMPFTSVSSGQNQILPQKTANKKAIRQNNGVVTKWPFNLNISLGSTVTPMRPQQCSTKGIYTLLHSNYKATHKNVLTSTHTLVKEQHTEYIYVSLVLMKRLHDIWILLYGTNGNRKNFIVHNVEVSPWCMS